MERAGRPYEEQDHAIKTWRYLRLGMVAMVVGLAVSVVYELSQVGWDCVQTSISAYYYTPVQAFFVGALVSIGVCLFCLKGSTELEDILLNLAGVFAPVVAFVPTSDPDSCKSVTGALVNPDPIVENNVFALLAVGLAGLITVAVLVVLSRGPRPTATALAGYGFTWVVWIVATYVFIDARDWVVAQAHDYAAIAMFACIFLVVCLNALGFKLKTSARTPGNRYALVAGAMVVAAIGSLAFGGDYRIIAIEASLILLFAAFWVIQTWELWDVGLRDVSART